MWSSLDALVPDYAAIFEELRAVRRAGLVRLRGLGLPALTQAAGAYVRTDRAPGSSGVGARVEQTLRIAVAQLGGGKLQDAAEYTLGLAHGTRDWPAPDHRRRTAQVYGVSVERFRKHHEPMLLGQIADRIVQFSTAAETDQAAIPEPGITPPHVAPTHSTLLVRVNGRTVPVGLVEGSGGSAR